MTTAQAQRLRAANFYTTAKNSKRDTKTEISEALETTEDYIKRELKFNKDLRNVEYLEDYLALRHFYKRVLNLIAAEA